VLEARSCELFLCPEWVDGTWTYEKIGDDVRFTAHRQKGPSLILWQ